MLQCKNCKFKRGIPGDAHVACGRPGVKVDGVNEHGVMNGWFMFPINFDPIWAEACNGFVPASFDLEKASDFELLFVFKVEEEKLSLEQKGKTLIRKEGLFSRLSEPREDEKFLEEETREKVRSLLRTLWSIQGS